MRIPRKKIKKAIAAIKESNNIKLIHYRELFKDIDHTNFQISTKVDFKKCKLSWSDICKNNVIFSYKSKTGSLYIVNNIGDVYRKSDHWGAIASCEWTIEGKGQLIPSIFETGEVEIGVANLSDFKIFLRKNLSKKDYILNPIWKEKISELKETFDILNVLKFDESFVKRPGKEKKFIGENWGQMKKIYS